MELDNLDSLSNAELRAKCIEAGLPNVPVTDSSRNLLVKRLRASMGGTDIAQTKKAGRRETIHVVSKAAANTDSPKKKVQDEPTQRTSNRANTRRTITAVPSASNKDRVDSAIPAPITNRRRSALEYSLPKAPSTVVAADNQPYVILESDEEDNVLVMAAEKAEKKNQTLPKRPLSRSGILTNSGTVTTSYNVKPVMQPAPILEEVYEEQDEILKNTHRREAVPEVNSYTARAVHDEIFPSAPSARRSVVTATRPFVDFAQPMRSSIHQFSVPQPAHQASTYNQYSRYSTTTNPIDYYAQPQGFATSASTTTRRITPTPQYIEQSDEEESYETPYLSSFARNLERLKTDSVIVGDSTIKSRHMRRSQLRGNHGGMEEASFGDLVRQFILAMEEKYQLKRYFALVLTILLAVLVFVLFFM